MCTLKEVIGLEDKSNYTHQLLLHGKQKKLLCVLGGWTPSEKTSVELINRQGPFYQCRFLKIANV